MTPTEILDRLFDGYTLDADTARGLLVAIAESRLNGSQIAAVASILRCRSITLEEVEGFRSAMLDVCTPVDLTDFDPIDLCGTGGDGKNTFNISTAASFVVAGAGVCVAKHGNYSFSSKSGSSNVLEHLGIELSNDEKHLRRCLETSRLCFLHAPLFHTAFKSVQPVRKELGTRTFFNLLGPLSNPCRPRKQMVGVFNLEIGRLYATLLERSGCCFAVVHDLAGYDEISLTGSVRILTEAGVFELTPDSFGLGAVEPDSIRGGGSSADGARIVRQILEGRGTRAQNDVVLANAAVAIRVATGEELLPCTERARTSLVSGAARRALDGILSLQEKR